MFLVKLNPTEHIDNICKCSLLRLHIRNPGSMKRVKQRHNVNIEVSLQPFYITEGTMHHFQHTRVCEDRMKTFDLFMQTENVQYKMSTSTWDLYQTSLSIKRPVTMMLEIHRHLTHRLQMLLHLFKFWWALDILYFDLCLFELKILVYSHIDIFIHSIPIDPIFIRMLIHPLVFLLFANP